MIYYLTDVLCGAEQIPSRAGEGSGVSPSVENANYPASADSSFNITLAGDVTTAAADAVVDHYDRGAIIVTWCQALEWINMLSDDPVNGEKLAV